MFFDLYSVISRWTSVLAGLQCLQMADETSSDSAVSSMGSMASPVQVCGTCLVGVRLVDLSIMYFCGNIYSSVLR